MARVTNTTETLDTVSPVERERRVYEGHLLSIQYHMRLAKDALLKNPCYGMGQK